MEGAKGLRSDALRLGASVAIGVSAAAPAYSVATTAGDLADVVGLQAPAAILCAFVPNLLIAIASRELNRSAPDCGTAFFWARASLGAAAGWITGWAMLAASALALAGMAQVCGEYGLQWVAQRSPGRWQAATIGVGCIVLVTWVCCAGVQLSTRLQGLLLWFELLMLLAFSALALHHVHAASAGRGVPVLSWFNPFAIASPGRFAEAMLLTTFIFWGWDAALAVNEESTAPRKTPGAAALLSAAVLFASYSSVILAAQAYAGIGTQGIGLRNPSNGDDVLAVLGPALFGPGVGSGLLDLAVLISSVACIQATLLPAARLILSMAVQGALPATLARVHTRHLTPVRATVAVALAAILTTIALTFLGHNIVKDSVRTVSLLVALYYVMTALACMRTFSKQLRGSMRDFVFKGLLPGIGAALLLAAIVTTLAYPR
jgi:amino acid transporter